MAGPERELLVLGLGGVISTPSLRSMEKRQSRSWRSFRTFHWLKSMRITKMKIEAWHEYFDA
jgi:hypothetical protein